MSKITRATICSREFPNAFIVAQASYLSPLTEKADLVLPTAIWSEQTSTLTNIEGRIQNINKAVEPLGEAKPDWEVLQLLAEKWARILPFP